MENINQHPLLATALMLLKNEHPVTFIQKELQQKGLNPEQTDKLIEIAKTIIHKSRLKLGTICIVFGGVLLLCSFMFAMFSNFSDKHFIWGLYGLTGVGATLLVVGIIYIFN